MAESAEETRTIGEAGEPADERAARLGWGAVGSWFGAAASALGLAASATIVVSGGAAIMDEGGFVASGGPYEIAHPVPEGFWLFPVAFVGMWVFTIAYSAFASRINGFGLVYAVWCALWTSIGATTLWYGFSPPGGGFSWGWFIMGTVFLLVGLGSTWLYVGYLRGPNREPWAMPKPQRAPYVALVLAMLAAGVVAGFAVFGAVAG